MTDATGPDLNDKHVQRGGSFFHCQKDGGFLLRCQMAPESVYRCHAKKETIAPKSNWKLVPNIIDKNTPAHRSSFRFLGTSAAGAGVCSARHRRCA